LIAIISCTARVRKYDEAEKNKRLPSRNAVEGCLLFSIGGAIRPKNELFYGGGIRVRGGCEAVKRLGHTQDLD